MRLSRRNKFNNNPGVRSWIIACDESGVHGSAHYGFGSLWMKYQRRGEFLQDFRNICANHYFDRECKWSKAKSLKHQGFYDELIEYFFKRRWLAFHCLVVRKDAVKRDFHKNDWDLARRKHFTMLLTNKIGKALRRYPERKHEFRVYVDPIASRYKKADEAVEIISNNILNQKIPGASPVRSVITKDSKDTPAIQMCDLFLGAVMETWQQKATNPMKKHIRLAIAKHLGWDELNSDTRPEERKFNIWYFFDPSLEVRRTVTRKVNLFYPYP